MTLGVMSWDLYCLWMSARLEIQRILILQLTVLRLRRLWLPKCMLLWLRYVFQNCNCEDPITITLSQMLLPGPQYPPIVFVLIPNNGKEDAQQIHQHHMRLLKMASQLKLKVISC